MARKYTGISISMIVICFIVMFLYYARGFLANENKAIRALTAQGFSDIAIKDKSVFFIGLRGCSAQDAVMFTATAKNSVGKTVEVYVCAGLLKGATIRTD